MEEVTREDLLEMVEELCDLLQDYKGYKAELVLNACHMLTTAAADTHFEGLGILSEALIQWRESSLEVLNSDCGGDCVCDECKEKAQKDIEENLKDLDNEK